MLRVTLFVEQRQGCSERVHLNVFTGLVNREGVIVGIRKAKWKHWDETTIEKWFRDLQRCDPDVLDIACSQTPGLEAWIPVTTVKYSKHKFFMEDFELWVDIDARA
jgi:hypothetical protein